YFPTSFPIMTDNGPSVEPYAYNLGWDAEAQRLVSFFKGRGIGDCGTINEWAWEEGPFDRRLVLVSSRNKGECDGVFDMDAPAWVKLWPVAGNEPG
ncbi:MAG: DUF1176 domain-containing protein, partial [Pseudomonadota bacterium]